MPFYEYKVIPAPTFGKKAKGIKGADGRFANALAEKINEMANNGWEYMHAENLPSIERQGFTRKRREVYQNVLVFKRENNSEIAVETIEKAETFNPFKSFSNRKEPMFTANNKLDSFDEAVENEFEEPTDGKA
ncbi:DUF4177 domain-containing protein [Amylibacter sp.]|nr:DUF4177 domain-containing protein [Amylibacter sp.]